MEKIESGKMDFQFVPLQLLTLADQAIDANRGYAGALDVALLRAPTAVDGCVSVGAPTASSGAHQSDLQRGDFRRRAAR